MPTVPEILIEVQTSLLDLVGVKRSRGHVGRYSISNQLHNSIAHLAGQDGVHSRLLQCTDDALLKVVPVGGNSGRSIDVNTTNEVSVMIRRAGASAFVLAGNAAAVDTVGLVVSNKYLEELYDTIVTAKGPLGVVDHEGTNELGVTSYHEAKVEVGYGGVVALVGDADGCAADEHALSVRNYHLTQLYTLLADVWDPDNHCLRVNQIS